MQKAMSAVRLLALCLSLALATRGELVREANTTLNFPAELPVASGEPAGPVNNPARVATTLPATLSATGAFSNLATLTTYPGIVPYAPKVTFWSDYAIKSRWFSIKNLQDTVVFSVDGHWTLPTGMIWIKHFDFQTTRGDASTRRKLETRFLVKTAADVYGLSYKWREDQTDADLVGENGMTELIPSSSPAQTWRFLSRTECRSCHTPVAGFSLSFNTRQMNRTGTFGGQTQNQISALSSAGYFSAPVTGINSLPTFATANDATASLEWRVRSYLATNCVQCHQPGGACTAYWDARATTRTDLANLIAGRLVDNAGDAANRWCIPGDTAHSMVLKRIRGDGVGRMPPLATAERDLAAEALITEWITTVLPSRQSFAQWQTANFGGPDEAAAQPDADPDSDNATNSLEFLLGEKPLVPDPPYLLTHSLSGEVITLTFHHPANRSVLVETTTDFKTWSLWDVPGNSPSFPATASSRALSGPFDRSNRFFRLRLSEP